jgi:hypothetical protein
MSQLPNPFYNPSASPVSTGVTPFVPAPAPQQVQIGSGWGDLGAAFAQFSTTLANFVGQKVTSDRQKAMADGELKAMKSRTTFRKMVENGQIDPVANPWEALGAASADGVIQAERFKGKLKTEYDQKMLTDPEFGSSMSSVEDFVNTRMENELAVGVQNPIWQRSFMKESNGFLAQLSESHGVTVATNRRNKMFTAIGSQIGAEFGTLVETTKGKDIFSPESEADIKKAHATLQPIVDELSHTVGSAATPKMVEAILQSRIDSGNNPILEEAAKKIKLGTGYLFQTDAYKAAEFANKDVLDRASNKRDLDLLGKYTYEALKSGKPLSDSEFTAEARRIRPSISDEEVGMRWSAVQANMEPIQKRLIKDETNQLVSGLANMLANAYSIDPQTGRVPTSPEAMQARDPLAVKQALVAKSMAVYAKYGYTGTPESISTIVDNQMLLAKGKASVLLGNHLINSGMSPTQQGSVAANWSMGSETVLPMMSSVRAAYSQFIQNPVKDAVSPQLMYGLSAYQEVARSGGDFKAVGFSEDQVKFFARLSDATAGGAPLQEAAVAASGSVSLSSALPKDVRSKLGGVLHNELNTFRFGFGVNDANATKMSSDIAPYFEKFMAAPANEFNHDDANMAVMANQFINERVVELNGGLMRDASVFILPQYMDSSLENLRNPDAIGQVQGAMAASLDKSIMMTSSGKYASLEKANSVRFVLNPRTEQYNIYVVTPRGTERFPTDAEAEGLHKAGFDTQFSPSVLVDYITKTSIQSDAKLQGKQWPMGWMGPVPTP